MDVGGRGFDVGETPSNTRFGGRFVMYGGAPAASSLPTRVPCAAKFNNVAVACHRVWSVFDSASRTKQPFFYAAEGNVHMKYSSVIPGGMTGPFLPFFPMIYGVL